jgi:hypothetical protein
MKNIQINTHTFQIASSFDELDTKCKEMVLNLLYKNASLEVFYPKFLALLLRFSVKSMPLFSKIKAYFFIASLKSTTIYYILSQIKPYLEAILAEFKVSKPPYHWINPLESLTFFQFRQINNAINQYNTTRSEDALEKLSLIFINDSFQELNIITRTNPKLLLIYFNTQMKFYELAFPHLFIHDEDAERSSENPWRSALKHISTSPFNMEENDQTNCLTVFQWMEEIIKQNLKNAANDNRARD